MNWRLIVVAVFVIASLEAVFGFAAYGSYTTNWSHTEIVTGWEGVRLVCLQFVPVMITGTGMFVAIVVMLMRWAVGR